MSFSRALRPQVLLSICLPLVLAASAPAAPCQRSAAAAPPPRVRPNVLLIVADDLAAGALGAYGNLQCRTPAVDGLAARGMRFDRAYCQFPVCGPSRVALLSGLYPRTAGVMDNGQAELWASRDDLPPTFPQLFRASGWQTTRISKIFHMRVPGDITAGVNGADHGASWDRRFNCKAPEWQTPGSSRHLGRGKLKMDPDKHYDLGFGTAFYVVEGKGNGAEQADDQAASRAIQVLQEERDHPFFLAVGFVRPHVPLVAPESYYAPYAAEDMALARSVENDADDIPKLGRSRTSVDFGLTAPSKQRQVLRAYYASVSYMDAQVGRILEALDTTGQTDNTIVIFTSDHGYHLGEHDFWQKLSLHEESARIPLVLAGPGVEVGTTGSLAQQIDLYPTLADMAELDIPAHLQGKSLAPVLANPATEVHDHVYCGMRSGHMLRTTRYAFLRWEDGSVELYDMLQDPLQFRNRAGDADLAPVEIDLSRRLDTLTGSF